MGVIRVFEWPLEIGQIQGKVKSPEAILSDNRTIAHTSRTFERSASMRSNLDKPNA